MLGEGFAGGHRQPALKQTAAEPPPSRNNAAGGVTDGASEIRTFWEGAVSRRHSIRSLLSRMLGEGFAGGHRQPALKQTAAEPPPSRNNAAGGVTDGASEIRTFWEGAVSRRHSNRSLLSRMLGEGFAGGHRQPALNDLAPPLHPHLAPKAPTPAQAAGVRGQVGTFWEGAPAHAALANAGGGFRRRSPPTRAERSRTSAAPAPRAESTNARTGGGRSRSGRNVLGGGPSARCSRAACWGRRFFWEGAPANAKNPL
jgi:hypothetical protein